MPCGRVSLRVRGREHDGSQALSVRPREAPRAPLPLGRTSLRANVIDGHGLDPVGQRVVLQAHCLSRIKFLRAPENRVAVAGGLTVRCDLAHHGVDLGVQVLRPREGIDVESIEHLPGLRRVEDVCGLVDAELFEDDRQLLLQHFAHAVLHRVPHHEVDRADRVFLADTVDAADPLFELHRIPGNVVVDHHVAELQVQPLAAGVGRHQKAGRAGERTLHVRALVQSHRSVEADYREAAVGQKPAQHLLRRDELREDQDLQVGVAFVLLQTIDPVEQSVGFGVHTGCLGALLAVSSRSSTSARSFLSALNRLVSRVSICS